MNDKELLIRIRVQSPEIVEVNNQLDVMKNRLQILNDIEKENGTLTDKQNQRLAETKDATRQLIDKKQDLIQAGKDLKAINDTEEGSIARLQIATAQMTKELKGLADAHSAEGQALLKKIQDNREQINDFNRSISGSGTLVGEYGRGIITSFAQMGLAIISVQGIISGFHAVVNSNRDLFDKYQIAVTAAKTAAQFFLNSLLTGNLENFGARLKDVVDQAVKYKEVLFDLENRTRSYTIEQQKEQGVIEQLEIKARNVNLSEKERLAAYEEITKRRKALGDEITNISLQKLSERTTLMSKESDLSEYEIKQFVSEYKSMQDVVDMAVKYNKAKKEIDDLRFAQASKNTGDASKTGQLATVDPAIADAQARLDELTRMGGVGASQLLAKYGTQTKEKLDELAQFWRDYIAASNQAFSDNMRDKQKENALIHKDNSAEQKAAKAESEKEMKDLEKQLDDDAALQLWRINKMAKEMKAFTEKSVYVPGLGIVDKKDWKMMQDAAKAEQKEAEKNLKQMYQEDANEEKQWMDQEIQDQNNHAKAITKIADETAKILGTIAEDAAAGKTVSAKQASLAIIDMALEELKVMIPIWVAEFVGGSLATPQSILTLGGAGLIEATALTAILEGFVAIAEGAAKGALSGKASGGIITASDGIPVRENRDGDNQLILARRGEVVLNDHQQYLLGADALRSARVPGFALGGIVGNSPGQISLASGSSFDYMKLAEMTASLLNSQTVQLNMNDLDSANSLRRKVKTRSPI